jgi:hypothetical protein
MAGAKSAFRTRLFRAIHAEAPKRGFDHDGLHDMCTERFGVHSMSQLSDDQLLAIYRGWTGKTLKRRASLADPGWKQEPDAMVSGEELTVLDQEFAKRGLGHEGRRNFVRRQLRGRESIRSRKDYVRVLHGIRAMNARENL